MITELNMEPGKLKTGYGGGKSDEEWEKVNEGIGHLCLLASQFEGDCVRAQEAIHARMAAQEQVGS